jgi:hypothetical protein
MSARTQHKRKVFSIHRIGATVCVSIFRSLVVVVFVSGCASAGDADTTLLPYAVSINQTAGKARSGTGIYLGRGLVLTASHVIGTSLFLNPQVTIGGLTLPGRILKQDSFERSDLALLAIDDERLPTGLRLRRISLCAQHPWPGEDVITVVPEETVHSQVMNPVWLPLSARQFDTVISDVARTGNSGSGVFDAKAKCLLGIMSRKISQVLTQKGSGAKTTYDLAKYFVSASKIADFMPAEFRF